ncbi:hypothetical protein SCHPADRAFT_943595 [Schizopora paradoxa]|uniref:Uncharacterized protein n=1 Tax=Schizopora paradoxa TaxID=27342 RepID=A0A0H2RCG3_9AGAM|nr:hypothetical protein SCHPADRAFT_943595 [Schizopora paradoxa]
MSQHRAPAPSSGINQSATSRNNTSQRGSSDKPQKGEPGYEEPHKEKRTAARAEGVPPSFQLNFAQDKEQNAEGDNESDTLASDSTRAITKFRRILANANEVEPVSVTLAFIASIRPLASTTAPSSSSTHGPNDELETCFVTLHQHELIIRVVPIAEAHRKRLSR